MARLGVFGLTPRQETYLRGICRGYRRKDVAAREFVSEDTVRCGLNAVYRAMHERSAAGACYRLGLFDQHTRDMELAAGATEGS